MATTIADFNLPAMCHVVCTLVATGITGINVTGSVSATTSTPPPQPTPLPKGYVAYSDVGVAYKLHEEEVTWLEAKRRCLRDGARLALIDSIKKLGYVKSQNKSSGYAYVGIVRMYDTIWVDDTTGEELKALPWLSGFPTSHSNWNCVLMYFETLGLRDNLCAESQAQPYVCEIPLIAFHNDTLTVS